MNQNMREPTVLITAPNNAASFDPNYCVMTRYNNFCRMPIIYSLLELMSWYSTNMFFRDIIVVNPENMPSEGPTIVYGNHNNQFVDGMVADVRLSFS